MTFPTYNIVLYQPEIPANTGNIGRLCVGSNAMLHIIKPARFLMDDKSLKRAGLDYWQHLSFAAHNSLDDCLKGVDPQRIWYCTTKSTNAYWNQTFQPGDYFLFGPESRGLPEDLLHANPDQCITIPQSPLIRSLNLSNSVAIILYEALRQQMLDK